MKAENVSAGRIVVLEFVERESNAREDKTLDRSIREGGIQQPLIVVESDGKLLLVDGLRRLRIAKSAGIGKVPVAVDTIPKAETAESYIRKMRFVLDEHRQDLLPTQKADLILTLKQMFGLKSKQVAVYLGIDQDSVTNWLAVKSYAPEIQAAVDAGTLSMQAAKVFAGMTAEGHSKVWSKHERELTENGGGARAPQIRGKYPPEKFPAFYANPEKQAVRSERKGKPTKTLVSAESKAKLANSYEVKETELVEGQAEQEQLKREIRAAIPIVGAIMRQKQLWALVPAEMREELEHFASVYV